MADDDWQGMGADKMLVKPMQTRVLIGQIEKLLESHQAKLRKLEAKGPAAAVAAGFAAGMAAASVTAAKPVKAAAKRSVPAKKAVAKKTSAKKAVKAAK